MKKMISMLLAAAMAVSTMSVTVSAEDTPADDMTLARESRRANPVYALGTDISAYPSGDVNMDGFVNVSDAMLVLNFYNFTMLSTD